VYSTKFGANKFSEISTAEVAENAKNSSAALCVLALNCSCLYFNLEGVRCSKIYTFERYAKTFKRKINLILTDKLGIPDSEITLMPAL